MKKALQKNAVLVILLLISVSIFAQTPTPAPPTPVTITWGGYVKTDYMLDSRATANLRENDLLFLPAVVDPDASGKDKNDVPQYNSLSIQSRVRMTASGPEFFKMKATGVIEAEFFGNSAADENGLRLRHAYVQLTGAKTQITMGQYYHPFFTPECFPEVYGYSTGSPFATFTRNPQFRISSLGKTKIFAALLTERDFESPGPTAQAQLNADVGYLKNALVPMIDIGIQHQSGNLTVGATMDLKTLRPRTAVVFAKPTLNVTTNETVTGVSFNAYAKIKSGNTTFKISGIYGSNIANMLMTGGYAESAIDSTTGKYTYTPMNALNVWVELMGKNGAFEWGLFGGYLKNLGLSDPLATNAGAGVYQFSLTTNVMNVTRASGRIGWRSGRLLIGTELEYTTAQRGAALKGGEKELSPLQPLAGSTVARDVSSVVRLMVTAMYNF